MTEEGLTPNGSTIQVHTADGDVLDVTESVKFAYDAVIGSLDWGSGFLSHEEQHLVYDLGEKLGFELPGMSCFYEKRTYPDGKSCPKEWHDGLGEHWDLVHTGTCQLLAKADTDD